MHFVKKFSVSAYTGVKENHDDDGVSNRQYLDGSLLKIFPTDIWNSNGNKLCPGVM